ncbi:MAG: hypothetical protein ACEPOV_00535 [Hyphomicrobiales bacterium]
MEKAFNKLLKGTIKSAQKTYKAEKRIDRMLTFGFSVDGIIEILKKDEYTGYDILECLDSIIFQDKITDNTTYHSLCGTKEDWLIESLKRSYNNVLELECSDSELRSVLADFSGKVFKLF